MIPLGTTGAATGGAAAARSFQKEGGLVVGDSRERAKVAAERRLHESAAAAANDTFEDASSAVIGSDDGSGGNGGGGGEEVQCACGTFHNNADLMIPPTCILADGVGDDVPSDAAVGMDVGEADVGGDMEVDAVATTATQAPETAPLVVSPPTSDTSAAFAASAAPPPYLPPTAADAAGIAAVAAAATTVVDIPGAAHPSASEPPAASASAAELSTTSGGSMAVIGDGADLETAKRIKAMEEALGAICTAGLSNAGGADGACGCIRLLSKSVANIVQNPAEAKYKSIKKTNKKYVQATARFPTAVRNVSFVFRVRHLSSQQRCLPELFKETDRH